MQMPLTIACVLRSGGRYSPIWVRRLKAMVAKNLSLPHEFVCLTDMNVDGVDTILLRKCWPKWWSKIELWSGVLSNQRRAS